MLPPLPLQVYAMTNWRRGFHFFGRNDIEAWSADGTRLLRCRTPQLPHDMAPSDVLHIGYVPYSEGAPPPQEALRSVFWGAGVL